MEGEAIGADINEIDALRILVFFFWVLPKELNFS